MKRDDIGLQLCKRAKVLSDSDCLCLNFRRSALKSVAIIDEIRTNVRYNGQRVR